MNKNFRNVFSYMCVLSRVVNETQKFRVLIFTLAVLCMLCRRLNILVCGTLIVVCSYGGSTWIDLWRSSLTNMRSHHCCTLVSCITWITSCPFKILLLG